MTISPTDVSSSTDMLEWGGKLGDEEVLVENLI
jgi:hypothetical protein